MTYFRVSIKGTVGVSDVWSVNPCFWTNPALTWDAGKGLATAQAIGATVIPLRLAEAAGIGARVTGFRLELHADDHSLLGAAEAPLTAATSFTAPVRQPPQASVVLSLRSDSPGASGRGRLYWPALAVTLDSPQGRIGASTRDQIKNDAITYLRAVQDAIKGTYMPPLSAGTVDLAVISKTKGEHHLITRILVGDVIDTQRRRRDKIPENYTQGNFPGA